MQSDVCSSQEDVGSFVFYTSGKSSGEELHVVNGQPCHLGHSEVPSQTAAEAMSESVAIYAVARVECQCLYFIFPLEDMGMSLVREAARGHLDMQGLRRTGLARHWEMP